MIGRGTVFVCKWITLAVMALYVVSCTKGSADVPEKPDDGEQVRILVNISMEMWTKVTDAAYETGDQAGIYVVNYTESGVAGVLETGGNHVDNMRFSYSGSWAPDKEIYWPDGDAKADFYCYYPYGNPVDVTAYQFSVQTDQSSVENYKASEFLWGKVAGVTRTANAVPVVTRRSMSNMLIYLKPGDGFSEEAFAAAPKSVRICNVKPDATVDLRTGVAAATGSGSEIVPYYEDGCYRALIVPQTVDGGFNLIALTIDGVEYTYANEFTFKPNTRHEFTITVNKSGGGMDITIDSWEQDNEDHGGFAE